MGKKKKRRKPPRKPTSQYSGLAAHQRQGTKLLPPLAKLSMEPIDYERDLLPEHLWIAALVDRYGLERAHLPFSDLLDAIDEAWTQQTPCLGTITDLGLVPDDARAAFRAKHRDLIRAAFQEPFGRLLAFYPDSPATWLIEPAALEDGGPLDPDVELAKLRRLVLAMLPGKDDHAGHVRTLPFIRLLKHGKMHFMEDLPILEILPKYRAQCDDDERGEVQSFIRMAMNTEFMQLERFKDRTWPKYFWRHNYDLAACRRTHVPITGAKPLTENDAPPLIAALEHNADRACDYLDGLALRLRCDLYDPTRDEILFGLFARCTRLYVLMTEDANLWARDTAGIILRCLADTAITFGYLCQRGIPEDFTRYQKYGEGQEKLLMLHLQDTYPGQLSLEGRSADDVGGALGRFMPELIQIELGSWSKQDTRELAQQAGMERLYRLVYAPTSSDLHGTWMSLKHSNLSRCAEPLHRFHRLPTYIEPPVFVASMLASHELYQFCADVGVKHLNYPKLDPPLQSLKEALPKALNGHASG